MKTATSWKKGDPKAVEAGKKGKRKPLDHQWREKLNKSIGDSDRTALDAIYGILLNAAKEGNIMAIRELLDRSFGKAIQFTVTSDAEKAENPVLKQITEMKQAIIDQKKIVEVKDAEETKERST